VINFHGKLIITQRKTLSSLQNSWSFFFMRDYSFFTAPFFVIGNFVPITKKMLREDRTAAELNNVANATRRRRRILQAGFLFSPWQIEQ
ncbi:MAG: hypothetical protein SPJ65_09510, partial [Roseburia sp.]|nr:hypothetical protein [Roseburia sp.]